MKTNIVEKTMEVQRRLECYFDDGDCGDWSAEELYGFVEETVYDAIECAKLVETALLEKDMAYAEAMALVLSHEGKIDKLGADFDHATNAYHNACACGCIQMNYAVGVLDEYFGIKDYFGEDVIMKGNEDDQDNQI